MEMELVSLKLLRKNLYALAFVRTATKKFLVQVKNDFRKT